MFLAKNKASSSCSWSTDKCGASSACVKCLYLPYSPTFFFAQVSSSQLPIVHYISQWSYSLSKLHQRFLNKFGSWSWQHINIAYAMSRNMHLLDTSTLISRGLDGDGWGRNVSSWPKNNFINKSTLPATSFSNKDAFT